MATLKRSLGLAQCIFFGVGSILGAGIYTLIGKVAGLGGNMTWLAFGIASFTAFLTAFSYAELSAMFPRAGGEYVYTRKAFGKRVGTVLGLLIATNGIISAATVSLGFAGYFSELVQWPLLPVALGIIGLLLLVNTWGIKESSTINIVLTGIEVLGLVAVGVAAYPSLGNVDLLEMPSQGFNGLFLAASLSFFAYLGFEEIVKLAEEARDPQRTIPRALFAANGIVLVVYTVLAILVVSAMSWQELSGAKAPLAAIMESSWGRTGAVAITVAALFSTSNTLLSNMLGSSRVLFDMGGEVKAMRWLGVLSKRRTPVAALVLIALVAGAFALIGAIEQVARLATISIFLTFLAVNGCAIALRWQKPRAERPYRMPFAIGRMPVIPLLAIAFTLLLLGYAIAALVQGEA
jgi:APA family basic amino acid/polyamine antiporter